MNQLEVDLYALDALSLNLSVNLKHTIRIVVLTLKNHKKKSAEFWAQTNKAGDIADELV